MWPFGNKNYTVERANEIASGKSTEPVAKAEAIYLACVKENQPKAKSSLGFHYTFGTFGKGRVAEGVALLNEAATEGDHAAYSHLGLAHAKGLLGKVDHEAAMECYRKAADNGDGASAYNIGVMLMKGEGCEVDLLAARASFEHSRSLGIQSAAGMASHCENMIAEIQNNAALYRQMGKPYVPSFKVKKLAVRDVESLKPYAEDKEYVNALYVARTNNAVGIGQAVKLNKISIHINNLSFHTGIPRESIVGWIIDGNFSSLEESIRNLPA